MKPSLDTRLNRIERMLEILTFDLVRRKPFYNPELAAEVHRLVEVKTLIGKKKKDHYYREMLKALLDYNDPNKVV